MFKDVRKNNLKSESKRTEANGSNDTIFFFLLEFSEKIRIYSFPLLSRIP